MTKKKLKNAQSHGKTLELALCYIETCTWNSCLRLPRVACWVFWQRLVHKLIVLSETECCEFDHSSRGLCGDLNCGVFLSVCTWLLFFRPFFASFLQLLKENLKIYKSFDIFLVTEALILRIKQWSKTLTVMKYWILMLPFITDRDSTFRNCLIIGNIHLCLKCNWH